MMDAFLYQVFSGVASGAIYAGLALAIVMIYQSTHHVNFAQGEMAMFSTYVAWSLLAAGLSYWVAFAATLAISFAGGVLIERFILATFAQGPVIALVIAFVGLLVIFNSLAGFIFGYTTQRFPSPFPAGSVPGFPYMSIHEIGAIGVIVVLVTVLYLFFRFTPLGLAMRAAAVNPVSARLSGIRVGWMIALGWGLAAALGSVSGMMVAPIVYLDQNMMAGVLLYAFAGALIGGIDNPWGAAVGGLIVGVLENVLGAYVIGTELKLTVALVIIIGVLVVRPNGLFGKVTVTRV